MLSHGGVTERVCGVRLLTNKQARYFPQRKFCFLSDAGHCAGVGGGEWRGGLTSVRGPTTAPGALGDRKRGPHAEAAQAAQRATLTSLTRLSGTLHLLLQSPSIPVSLRPVLGTAAAFVVGTVLTYA